MSKNIEVWQTYNYAGQWTLNIRKKRGTLTLDEIRQAATDYEQDFYLLVIKAMDEDTSQYYVTDDLDGDYVQLLRADNYFAWREK